MKEKLSKYDILSFIGIFLITIGSYLRYANIVDTTLKDALTTTLCLAGVGFLFIEIIQNLFNKKYTKKQLLIVATISILGLLVWYRMIETYLSITIALHFLNKDLRKMIKWIFISSLVAFLCIVALNMINILPDATRLRSNGLVRQSLGFYQPNVAFRLFLPIVISGAIYFKSNKLFLLVSFIFGMMLFILTNSKGGIAALAFFLFLCVIPKAIKKKLFISEAIPYLFIVGFALSASLAVFFHDESNQINILLTTRPWCWYNYFPNIKLIGETPKIEGIVVDNIYLHCLIFGGVYSFLCYVWLYFLSFNKADNKGNYNLFILFVFLFVYGFAENCTSQGESFLLILLIMQLLDKEKLREIKDDYVYENKSSN